MTVHSTTGVTPNQAMLGSEVLLPVSLIVAPPGENIRQSGYVQDFQENLRQAHQQVRQAMGSSAIAEKTYFDRRVFILRGSKGLALLAKNPWYVKGIESSHEFGQGLGR